MSTDGDYLRFDDTVAEATQLKNDGVVIFGIGMYHVNSSQIEPDLKNYEDFDIFFYKTYDFFQLKNDGEVNFGIGKHYKPWF